MQWTMTMMKPSKESKTAKRIWKRAERRSVMARTADIQVRARRGRTTQELHSEALQDVEKDKKTIRLVIKAHSQIAECKNGMNGEDQKDLPSSLLQFHVGDAVLGNKLVKD